MRLAILRTSVAAFAVLAWVVCRPTTGAADDTWIDLTPADSFAAWRSPAGAWAYVENVSLDHNQPRRLSADGTTGAVLYNGPAGKTSNLITRDAFGDVAVHAEFLVPKGSNSGIKLQGVYEVQIADSFGKQTATASDCGGIYPRAELLPSYHHIDDGYPPRSNACRAPGEWQTLDVVFRSPQFDSAGMKTANARFDRVVLNGSVIHENVELPCPTGHAWRKPETARGPILLQGDHGPVAFRNVSIRTLVQDDPAKQSKSTEINATFNDPKLNVDDFVKRFETDNREVYARRNEIAKALDLKPGLAVADVGAGTGLYTMLFAELVKPGGTVFAVDIADPFLKHIDQLAKARGYSHIKTVKGTQSSTELPANSVDVAFLCDTYHHLEKHELVLDSIHKALRPGGRLFLVEFNRTETASDFIKSHVRAGQDVFIKEVETAGFEKLAAKDLPALKENFIAAFRKVDTRKTDGGETPRSKSQ